jgi:hypothetical protein
MMSPLKKTLHASEQDRPDVKAAREAWRENQASLDPAHLVFIDETATATNMTRLRGRSIEGQRLIGKAPQGHRKTTTFVAALRNDRITAPLVMDGAMNGASFVQYVEQFLVPALMPNDIVVMDNLPVHKVAGVRSASLCCTRAFQGFLRIQDLAQIARLAAGHALSRCRRQKTGVLFQLGERLDLLLFRKCRIGDDLVWSLEIGVGLFDLVLAGFIRVHDLLLATG